MPRSDVTVEMRADSRRLRRDLYRARREWNTYSRQVRSQVRGIAREAATIGTVAAGAAIGLVSAAVREFERFNRELVKTQTLVGITDNQFRDLQKSVFEVGRTTGVALNELANASVGVYSAQVRGAQALDVITTSAKLSALGFGEARTQADLLTSAVRTYGEAALPVARAGDIFFAAVREGNFDPREFATSLSRVLPIAKQFGVEFEEIAGAFASLSLVGIAPPRAASALIGIFSAILKPTQQGIDVLAEYGLTIDQVREAVEDKGLIEALDAVFQLFDGNLDAIGKFIPSLEGLPGFLSLLGENAEDSVEIVNRVGDSLGDLEEGYRKLESTGVLAFDKLNRELSILGVSLGEAISEELYRRAEDVTAALQEMGRFIPEVSRSIVAFSGNFANFVRIVYENRDAIQTLIKAYVGLRVVMVSVAAGNALIAGAASIAAIKRLTQMRKAVKDARFVFREFAKNIRNVAKSGLLLVPVFVVILYLGGLLRRAFGQTTEAAKALQQEIENVNQTASDLIIEQADIGKPYREAVKDVNNLETEVRRLTQKRDNLVGPAFDESLFQSPAALANREALIEQNQAELAQAEEELRIARARRDLLAQDLDEIKRSILAARTEENRLQKLLDDERGGTLLSPTANIIKGLEGVSKSVFSGIETAFDFVTDGYDGLVEEATEKLEEAEDQLQQAIEGPVFEDAPSPTAEDIDLEPFRFEGGILGSAIVSGIDEAIRNNSSQAVGLSILEGINSTVQSAASNVLQAGLNTVFQKAFGDTLQNTIEAGLTKIFSSAFDAVGSLLGGLFGAAGAASGGAVAAPTAHGGGYIPGFRGQEVPIIAQAGELVLTERQQQRLLGGGSGVNVTINATGDVTEATQRALSVAGRQVAHLLQQQRREGVYVG